MSSKTVRYYAIGTLVLLLVIFGLQNHEQAAIDVLFWTVSAPRSLLVFAAFGGGALAGWLVGARPRGSRP